MSSRILGIKEMLAFCFILPKVYEREKKLPWSKISYFKSHSRNKLICFIWWVLRFVLHNPCSWKSGKIEEIEFKIRNSKPLLAFPYIKIILYKLQSYNMEKLIYIFILNMPGQINSFSDPVRGWKETH